MTDIPATPSFVPPPTWLTPAWSRPMPQVRALMTSRQAWEGAGILAGAAPYADFNVGDHVGDALSSVMQRRDQLAQHLGGQALWLQQVHGNRVVRLDRHDDRLAVDGRIWSGEAVQADGSVTTAPGLICTVMVADCLPVLLLGPEGQGVAALHAGWRGLLGAGGQMCGVGILETGVQALCEAVSCQPGDIQAWLGPCIGPEAFEVGHEVVQAAQAHDPQAERWFTPKAGAGPKWWAHLPGLAQDRLRAMGLRQITGGHWCTVSNPGAFFSFRRDGITGRQAACIVLASH